MSTARLGPLETRTLSDGNVLLERDVGFVNRDGLRLSLDVYRPNHAGRLPGILEHIPYRKDDLRASDDRAFGIFFASRGFAYVRLDVRGTGNSEGVALDEYTLEEQLDGVEAVDWIASQPWCTGCVGSWGKSYGGFACLQLASRRPPALKAIATVYATDDRYTDDMHFAGGALCALELAHYPMRILAMNALPPLEEPGESEEDFRARWLERVDATPAWLVRWLEEQNDGPYWRNGSVFPGYDRITCPVLIVAGWRDGYRTAMLRLAQRLRSPWQLLAGPWMHTLPDRGVPGPRYPFLPEMARWFHRHLAGGAPSGDRRPRTVFFLNEFDPPSRPPARVSGSWLASERWPENEARTVVLHLSPGGSLGMAPAAEAAELVCPFAPAVGTTSGNWCPPPPGHGLPADQRPDEGRSLVFTSEPLGEHVDVFGMPSVALRVAHPGPAAIVALKLADVSPDGESQLVTSGVLNLSHRDGHERPEPVRGPVDVEVTLQATGWRFRRGHRVRLAVAGNDWPTVWPLPTVESIVLHLGPEVPAQLVLPGAPADARPHGVTEPPPYQQDAGGWIDLARPSAWRIVTDTIAGTSGVEASDASGSHQPEEAIRTEESRRYQAFVSEADPVAAAVEGSAEFRLERAGLNVRSRARGRFGSTEDAFSYDIVLEVRANGERLHRRRWRGTVPRRLC